MLIALSGCATQSLPLGPMDDTVSGLVHTLSCHYPYKMRVCRREARRICGAMEDSRKTVIVGTGHSYLGKRHIKEGTWGIVVFTCE